MLDTSQMRLGRLPADLGRVAAHPQARDVINLSALPGRPVANDWGTVDGRPLVYPMFKNNILGICGPASLGHSQITQSANSGVEVALLDSDIEDAYVRLGGYVIGRPETDNGVNMLEVGLRLLAGERLAGRKLLALIAINPKDNDMVCAAAEFFGGLWTGWDLPLAWQGADVWDVAVNGSRSGKWAPRSWGGHATHVVSYSPGWKQLPTWTEDKPFTDEAQFAYMEECYAVLWEDTWARLAGGLCPAGLDLQKLFDLMKVLGG